MAKKRVNPRRGAVRLDQLLVERGLCADAKAAASLIMARKVRVADEFVTQPGTRFPPETPIEVTGRGRRFVSRGGEKLAAALARFDVTVRGRIALDAGASTGGFSHCLLEHGVARLYAVDVGYGQLRGSVAADRRVVVLERTNIGDLRREQLEPPIDLCVADLSYLSIVRSLPILRSLFEPGGAEVEILHLVKPLFEGIEPARMTNRGALAEILTGLQEPAAALDLTVDGLIASPILGNNGTIEFFARFRGGADRSPIDARSIEAALDEAMELLRRAPDRA